MCAAGCFFSEEEYAKERFENYTWRQLVEMKLVPDNHDLLIQALQTVHDNYAVKAWASQLYHTARDYGIRTNDELYALMVKRGLSPVLQEIYNGTYKDKD